MPGKPEIAIVIPYFGPWPEWFDFFLKSCSWNPAVQWLIYTDNSDPVSLPENVHTLKITLPELASLIHKRTGVIPQINHPYKLVDFKPAYGLIFQSDLADFNFWGYSDLDLVYGNITNFITSTILKDNDLISPGIDFIPGHFALFRNNENINHLFMLSPEWKQIFGSQRCFCFDEKYIKNGFELSDGAVRKFIRKKIKYHLIKSTVLKHKTIPISRRGFSIFKKLFSTARTENQDFNQVVFNSEKNKQVRLYQAQMYSDDIMKLREKEKNINIKWKQGVLNDSLEEIMYFHFQISKYEKAFQIYEKGKEEFELSCSL